MTKRINYRGVSTQNTLRGFLAAKRRLEPARHRRARQDLDHDETDVGAGSP